MKKTLLFLAVMVLFLSLSITILASEGQSWYVTKDENKQPIFKEDLAWVTEENGYYRDLDKIDDETDKVLYLTFDAGYENGNVARIVETLEEKGVKATFFVLPGLINKHTELVQKMLDNGHIIGNHSVNHYDMTKLSKEAFIAEIEGLEKTYKEAFGQDMPKYFRPPEGRFSRDTMRWTNEAGYDTIFWSFAYADWDNDKQMEPEKALEKVLSHTHNGAVILLHPTSATNAEILPQLIDTWREAGYRFGTLDELTGKQ